MAYRQIRPRGSAKISGRGAAHGCPRWYRNRSTCHRAARRSSPRGATATLQPAAKWVKRAPQRWSVGQGPGQTGKAVLYLDATRRTRRSGEVRARLVRCPCGTPPVAARQPRPHQKRGPQRAHVERCGGLDGRALQRSRRGYPSRADGWVAHGGGTRAFSGAAGVQAPVQPGRHRLRLCGAAP